ncbi:SGNH/GDSL hydrolase family protein [Demequina sp. SYSU T00192]|uniref:SGNH/GDSL hydrolase family protein n=1 Tax=Demequina litoralis TaxID=3051660 RepID=A0ABT8GDF8_9MICO|nr:SGNH/GDSL hydrolase family protein [Demequina sp. SYSU T00192]MDN4476704.1 SGNH/GDSL hydrolase family protein [Demequina sp. SYSU T00192]
MRYAAIGDSFTEGVGDPQPDGTMRGWADLVALGLAAAHGSVEYANFAIRGRLIEPIATEQLDAALALDPRPDVLTFNGSGNDMMRPGWDGARVEALTRRVVDRTADAGVRLVILSGPDPTERLPRGRSFSERADELMAIVDRLEAEHDHVTFVDNYRDPEMRRAAYWDTDRIHLNPLGHSRVAARVLAALDVETDLPVAPEGDAGRPGVLAEAAYVGRYVLPWIGRRLTGRSSGDGRLPKHPGWTTVEGPSA